VRSEPAVRRIGHRTAAWPRLARVPRAAAALATTALAACPTFRLAAAVHELAVCLVVGCSGGDDGCLTGGGGSGDGGGGAARGGGRAHARHGRARRRSLGA
jgi:hypothetical protein